MRVYGLFQLLLNQETTFSIERTMVQQAYGERGSLVIRFIMAEAGYAEALERNFTKLPDEAFGRDPGRRELRIVLYLP